MQGHVYRENGAWSYRVDIGPDPATGRRRQRYKGGFKTKAMAQDGLRDLLAKVKGGKYTEPSRQTLGEYLVEWLEGAKPALRNNTVDSYERAIRNWISPRIGAVPLVAVTPVTLQKLYGELGESGLMSGKGGLGARSVKLAHTVLHLALQRAVTWGMIPYNPAAADLTLPKEKKTELNVWSPEEALQFLTSTKDHPKYPLWALFLGSGLRRSEALGMRWQDVDFDQGRLHVVQALVVESGLLAINDPKTDTSSRVVEVERPIIDMLRVHRKAQLERQMASADWVVTDTIFTGRNGGVLHPQNVRKAFETACAEAVVSRLTPHGLRHTFATLALAAGIHPKLVQEMLGHANMAITMDLYSHSTQTMHREAAATIAAMLFGKTAEG